MRNRISLAGMAWLVLAGPAFLAVLGNSGSALSQTARSAIPNPHRHAKGEDVFKEVSPEIKIVEASVPGDGTRDNVVVNRTKTFRAFTVMTQDGFERIFVEDIGAEKTYEIEGVAWPNRPLDDPVWAGNYFVFDRSSNPHAATHYVFDMNKRALAAARSFIE